MTIATTPHLNFDGRAREALEFYGQALGVQPVMATYGQMGATDDPSRADRIVWGQVETENGIRVMAFDVWPHQTYEQGQNAFYVYLSGDDPEEITAVWKGLSVGAEIRQEFGPSAWSPLAGQLRDQFGVIWALDVRTPTEAN